MTDKQKLFANEYLTDFNATRAYKVAYPNTKNDNSAAVSSSKLLRNPKIQEYIAEKQKELQERSEITQDMVIHELAAVAFSKITDFVRVVKKQAVDYSGGEGKPIYDSFGNPVMIDSVDVIQTDKLTESQKKAIAVIKEGRNGIEVKGYDKVKALELLGRYFGMWNDKLIVGGTVKLEDLL